MVKQIEIQDLPIWEKIQQDKTSLSFELELTARCNNNCRHCYINLPANSQEASKELSPSEIFALADQAAEMGVLWCLLTGGEPLLRPDFEEIYLGLKKRGFLINVFTNACLITEKHVELFKIFPPRDIEISVYGVTRETYEAVTRIKGSFKAFKRGLNLLLSNGLKVTLKSMALRSNVHEILEIAKFCELYTKIPFKYDPFLHLRYDRDPIRNAEILAERLSPEEIVRLEMSDQKRFSLLQKNCDNLIQQKSLDYSECKSCISRETCSEFNGFQKLFRCGIGVNEFNISYDGKLRLCSSLNAPGTTFNLRTGKLSDGLEHLKNKARTLNTQSEALLTTCKSCPITNLCMWCPATAYLETGDMEGEVPYFCQVAHARADTLQKRISPQQE